MAVIQIRRNVRFSAVHFCYFSCSTKYGADWELKGLVCVVTVFKPLLAA